MSQDNVLFGKNGLFFVSIGGSEQIGLNCLLYVCDDQILVVDIGMGFPKGIPGVQVIIPDLSFLLKNKKKIIGLIITHIHEDHCGALQYALKCFTDIKIYCSKFCGHFIQAKLDESGCKEKMEFVEVTDGQVLKLGKSIEVESDQKSAFEVEFVNLTHSTLEMMALLIKTKFGTIFHTGDWKLDDCPVVGKPIDRDKLRAIGDKGVDVMMCDSTNALVKGHSKSEGTVRDGLKKIICEARGRVIITLFASNVGRMSTVLSIAQEVKKKVCLVGRSVVRVINTARDCGYLSEFPTDLTITEVEAKNYNPEELIILCTGCQGESLAALTKIVFGRHGNIRCLESDTIVFSSKVIPGNETAVSEICNQIYRMNCKLITQDMCPIHVSGHPARDELKEMYSLIRPKTLIPVHGEEMHLKEHAKFAIECGIPKVLIANNGNVVRINLINVSIVDKIQSGFVCMDGKLCRREDSPVLEARKKICENGVLVIFVQFHKGPKEQNSKVVDSSSNLKNKPGKYHHGKQSNHNDSFTTTVSVFAPGLLDDVIDKSIISDLILKIQQELECTIQDKDRENSFSYIALSAAKKICKARCGKEPIIKVHINFER